MNLTNEDIEKIVSAIDKNKDFKHKEELDFFRMFSLMSLASFMFLTAFCCWVVTNV